MPSRIAVVALLVAACSRGGDAPAATGRSHPAEPGAQSAATRKGASPAVSDDPAALDWNGHAMLDSLRDEGLRPTELVARLGLRPDAVVADVGAGPGFLTLPLARAVPRGRVIATDVNAQYLAVAARRAREAGLGNVETRVVAPDETGLADRSIDLALVCQVDQYVPDRVAFFAQLARALRPGGRVALVNFVRFRAPALEGAAKAGLRFVDGSEWTPTPPFYFVLLAPTGGPT